MIFINTFSLDGTPLVFQGLDGLLRIWMDIGFLMDTEHWFWLRRWILLVCFSVSIGLFDGVKIVSYLPL
jgi:hypothetical protein